MDQGASLSRLSRPWARKLMFRSLSSPILTFIRASAFASFLSGKEGVGEQARDSELSIGGGTDCFPPAAAPSRPSTLTPSLRLDLSVYATSERDRGGEASSSRDAEQDSGESLNARPKCRVHVDSRWTARSNSDVHARGFGVLCSPRGSTRRFDQDPGLCGRSSSLQRDPEPFSAFLPRRTLVTCYALLCSSNSTPRLATLIQSPRTARTLVLVLLSRSPHAHSPAAGTLCSDVQSL